jgi:hypothetical protein
MAAPTHYDLGALLGRTVSPEQGNAVIGVVTNMAKAYTRGQGFVDGVPNDEISGVILLASARLISNPRGIDLSETRGPESASLRGSFTGWTVAEAFTLNRYRKMAA